MRFVAIKSEAQQASAMIFKVRDLLVRQRTATINALRGHLAEFGIIAPKGPAHIGRLQAIIEDEPTDLPDPARALCQDLLEMITSLSTRISALDHEIARRARQDDTTKRLMMVCPRWLPR
jgi:transposase